MKQINKLNMGVLKYDILSLYLKINCFSKALMKLKTDLQLNELTSALDSSTFFEDPFAQENLLVSEDTVNAKLILQVSESNMYMMKNSIFFCQRHLYILILVFTEKQALLQTEKCRQM